MSHSTCQACRNGIDPPFEFVMAFQPIVDLEQQRIFAYEALVRGAAGEGAGSILAQVSKYNMYAFDQSARVKAIQTAAGLFPPADDCLLSINIMPNAVYDPHTCLRTSLKAAAEVGFPPERIMFEMTEHEEVLDLNRLKEIVNVYRSENFKTAIDDFGSGFSGLNLLAQFEPDLIKLDMELVRNIDADPRRRTIVSGIVRIAHDMGIRVIAEGIESVDELKVLRDMDIRLFQGFLLARPEIQRLPTINYPE